MNETRCSGLTRLSSLSSRRERAVLLTLECFHERGTPNFTPT